MTHDGRLGCGYICSILCEELDPDAGELEVVLGPKLRDCRPQPRSLKSRLAARRSRTGAGAVPMNCSLLVHACHKVTVEQQSASSAIARAASILACSHAKRGAVIGFYGTEHESLLVLYGTGQFRRTEREMLTPKQSVSRSGLIARCRIVIRHGGVYSIGSCTTADDAKCNSHMSQENNSQLERDPIDPPHSTSK